jgi:hypothetical protein
MGQNGFTITYIQMGQNGFGDKHSFKVFGSTIGKIIKDINLDNNILDITFEDGYRLRIFDARHIYLEQS